MNHIPGNFIETFSGKRFYFSNPVFDIEDIAHALSMCCRFTGHCSRHYSVAQHSILVASIMEDFDLGDPLEGLLHDAHEAYISDVARPWKEFLPDYIAFEARIEAKLRHHFNLKGETLSTGAKLADATALILEAKQLMPSKGADWDLTWCPDAVSLAADLGTCYRIIYGDPKLSKHTFLARFHRLMKDTQDETTQPI